MDRGKGELSRLRTPVLMVMALLTLVGGVSTGAFLIYVPAGWITLGLLGGVGLAYLGVVADSEEATP